METFIKILLVIVILAFIVGVIYVITELKCMKKYLQLEIGDQYLSVSRIDPKDRLLITVIGIDADNGTVTYNLRDPKNGANTCYGETTISYKRFFLTIAISKYSADVDYLGNNISQWKIIKALYDIQEH